MAKIIDGKKIADGIIAGLAKEASELAKKGKRLGLAVILVGDDPASQVYVRNKRSACRRADIASFLHDLPASTPENDLFALVHHLNKESDVHGILVQLPLPSHINEKLVTEAIAPEKDVDGFHPLNFGRLVLGDERMPPCTAAGVIRLIEESGKKIEGSRAVVIGRSAIVGKPVAAMLVTRHATVTVCHSKTKDIPSFTKEADIVVATVGRPNFVQGSWLKKGAVVIDVGISRNKDGKLVGDCDFDSCSKMAGAITPVPGGVGPMTIAMLLKNTLKAAKNTIF